MRFFLLFFTFLCLLGIPPKLSALEVNLEEKDNTTIISFNPEEAHFAVFQRFNDLWLVFSKPIDHALPAELIGEPSTGIIAQEKLNVIGGGGLRITFKEMQNLYLVKSETGYQLKTKLAPKEKTSKTKSKVNMLVLKDGLHVNGADMGTVLSAKSHLTGELYTVLALPRPDPQHREVIYGPFRAIPTHAGRVFVANDGSMVDVTQDNSAEEYFLRPAETASLPLSIDPKDPKAILLDVLTGDSDHLRRSSRDIIASALPNKASKLTGPSFEETISRLEIAMNKVQGLPVPADAKQPIFPYEPPEKRYATARVAPLEGVGEYELPLSTSPAALPEAEVLLPRYRRTGENDYRKFETKFLDRLKRAETEKQRNDIRMQLAKLAFSFERYHEASGLLEKIIGESKNETLSIQTKILLGAAKLLEGYPQEALPFLEKESDHLEADRLLWLAATQQAMGQTKSALKLFEQNLDASLAYPVHLQQILRIAEARALLHAQKPSIVEERMLDLSRLVPDGELPAEAKLILAKAYLQKNENEEAEKLLAEVAQSDNPAAAYLAQYEFVTYLMGRNELGVHQAIEHLENLRYLWRGGQLEQDILFRLGQLYLSQGDYRRGLDRLKYYTTYFSQSPIIDDVANTMTKTFRDIFFSDEIQNMDTLALLGLYYDFRELTPPGEEGDSLITQIGRHLQGLGLFRRAVDLLEHQLKFRTKSKKGKAAIGLELANLYLLDLRYNDGLDVLKRTYSDNLPSNLQQDRMLTTAKLLMQKKEYAKAHELMVSLAGHKSMQMRSDLAWIQEDYSNLILLLEPFFKENTSPQTWTEDEKLDFLKLSLAYAKTGQQAKIDGLKEMFPEHTKTPEIAEVLDFYKLSTATDAIDPALVNQSGPWMEIINELSVYNKFSDSYTEYKRKRDRERNSRKRFNRRMGQRPAPSRHQGKPPNG